MTTENLPEDVKHYSKKRKVLSAIIWIISWPIIIGVIAIILLVIASYVVASTNMNAPQGYQIRAMWALFVAVLVIICYGFIWLKRREKKPLTNISINVLRTYIWLGIILSASIMAAIPDPEASAVDAGINVEQTNSLFKPQLASDATINAVLAKVGATDTEWIETKFVDSYSNSAFPDQGGEYQAFLDTSGNWSYGVLTIKQDLDEVSRDTVVAHEYLHHVWFKTIDPDTKIKLTSDLITIYGKDPYMQERVASYSSSQSLQPTELFSYYCTEAQDYVLSPYVLGECGKYINRSTLVLY